jgi:plasmid maintenance system antidote protein VapI
MERYKKLSGLSYRKIAELANVNHAYVHRAINNPHAVSKDIIIKIADIIGCPADKAVKIWKDAKINKIRRYLETV